MAKLIYRNANVEIFDVEGRFKDDEEFTVQLKYDKARETFLVTIPEAKKAEPKEDKPKPVNVYDGLLTKIKGTITVRGNGKVNMDMPPALIKSVGVENVKADLNAAFKAVVSELKLND